MAIDVAVKLEKDFVVESDLDTVFDLLADVPRSASHFPKVEKLVDLGNNAFRWEIEKIGLDKYHLQTIYACTYFADKKAAKIWWTPIPGEGNSVVEGHWQLSAQGSSTRIHFEAKGIMTLPLPKLAKIVIAPVVKSEFNSMSETYIKNLKKTLEA
jgi:carbon monoxide dehydrogenase subunit G